MEEKKNELTHSFRSFSGARNLPKFFSFSGFYANNLGFTILELLIVIAVLGVLVSGLVVLINPVAQLEKSRDSSRKAEIKQLQSAMEQHYADNGSYPVFGTDTNPINGWAFATSLNLNKNGITYIKQVPGGINTKGNPCLGYLVASNGKFYAIFTILENENDPDALAVKTMPRPGITGQLVNGNTEFRVAGGTCGSPVSYTYNYWVHGP